MSLFDIDEASTGRTDITLGCFIFNRYMSQWCSKSPHVPFLNGTFTNPVYYNEHEQTRASNSLRTAPGLPSVVQSYAITALRRLEVGSHVFHPGFFRWGIRHKLCNLQDFIGFFLEASDGWATTSNEIWNLREVDGSFQQWRRHWCHRLVYEAFTNNHADCWHGLQYNKENLKEIESDKMACFFHFIVVLWWFYDGFGCHHRWP